MAIFGKRQTAPSAATATVTQPPPPPLASGAGLPVIVKASALKAVRYGTDYYPLVQAVIDYVNTMLRDMHFTRSEISQRALQVYHADYYLAQVNNGGHSQFIHNSRSNAEHTFRDALAGLTDMRAPHAEVLKDMMMWVAQNPKDAAAQNGFEVRAAHLEILDTAFYAADKKHEMIKLSALWIQNWSELKAVPDEDYAQEMKTLGQRNANFAGRDTFKAVQSLAAQTLDTFKVATGLLLSNLDKPEFLRGTGKGSYKDIEGRQEMAFLILSNVGKRLVVISNDEMDVRLYEYFDPDNEKLQELVRTHGFEKSFEFHKSPEYRAPKVGSRLARVSSGTVNDVVRVSAKCSAGAAIGLLLHKLNMLDASPTVAAHAVGTTKDGHEIVHWHVATDKGFLVIGTGPRGSVVTYNNGQPPDTPSCTPAEIDAFLQTCLSAAAI